MMNREDKTTADFLLRDKENKLSQDDVKDSSRKNVYSGLVRSMRKPSQSVRPPSTRVVLSSRALKTNGEAKEVKYVERVDNATRTAKEEEKESKAGELAGKKPKAAWRSYRDPNTNTIYYFNRETRETTWRRPLNVRIKNMTGVSTTSSTTDVVKSENTVNTDLVNKKSKNNKTRLTVFALGRDRTQGERGDTTKNVASTGKGDDEEQDEEEEIDVDDADLDVEETAITGDGGILHKKKYNKKKLSPRLKHFSRFKTHKVESLDAVPEEHEDQEAAKVSGVCV